ncbi:TPA: DUF551 domain-containing protein [Klebsiella pneumoniae]|nr:DUF551 domain-containing protein [Klebsiella pneumoniae]HBT7394037.1 DUF551 domain-containing protein [Klebsiella pneumoniae]
MTKSTITRERLEQLADNNTICKVSWDERIELAQIALAAMDSEPVAVIDLANLDYLLSGADADVWPPEREEMGDVLLYRHPQPAPVVPEEATPDSIEILASARRRDHAVFQWDEDQRNAAADSWNACRAAILAAATQLPGSDPATVPGKWIPVSEQMPEDRTQVILWDAEIGEVTSGHYSHKTHTFYHCGDAIENEITHWMPTPAAPQEMKGE